VKQLTRAVTVDYQDSVTEADGTENTTTTLNSFTASADIGFSMG
jgi:hypothetical protein